MLSKKFTSVAGAAAEASDAQFNYVTMLLHGDGTNGAQNNTFTDSSSNAFTITRNGNTTQGSFTPYGPTWSNYFDASSRFSCDRAAASFGTNSFTIECWWLAAGSQTSYAGLVAQNFSSTNGGWALKVNNGSNVVEFSYINSTPQNIVASVNVNDGAWHHLAITRSGTSLYMYVDGVLQTTGTLPSAFSFSSGGGNTDIGYQARDNAYIKGYVSNLRLVNGTALSTGSTYSVSTTPLTAVTNTSLLVCQSNRFIDNSSNAYALTVAAGTPSVQRFSPFSPTSAYSTSVIGGSGYFDGSGDYLTAPSTSGQLGAGDFTIECWSYLNSRVAVFPCIWGNYTFFGGGSLAIFAGHNSGNTAKYNIAINGTFPAIQSTTSIAYNQWVHLALVRSGTTITLYVNGVANGSVTSSATLNGTSGTSYIGTAGDDPSNGFINGYLSDLRVVVGTAVYTGAFTPPSAPLSTITNTRLHLKCSNASIVDNAMMNDLETVGNAQISTSVKKYGTGSIAFDGTGDWLLVPYNSSMAIQDTYTVEAWIYPVNTSSGYRTMFMIEAAPGTAFGALSLYQSGTTLGFEVRPTSGGGITTISGGTLTANTWQHVAISVSATSGKLFLNGTQVGSTTTLPNYSFSVASFSVGGHPNGTSEGFNGYIDDLRITKGVARYTSNFTVPSSAFPDK